MGLPVQLEVRASVGSDERNLTGGDGVEGPCWAASEGSPEALSRGTRGAASLVSLNFFECSHAINKGWPGQRLQVHGLPPFLALGMGRCERMRGFRKMRLCLVC
jgi:hypothetical protein